jgi:hypothetical protein
MELSALDERPLMMAAYLVVLEADLLEARLELVARTLLPLG